jgi:hypothetical protein
MLKSELIWKTFREMVDVMPETFDMPYPSYDQITFPEGYEKPPKELFENKFNEFLREENFIKLREQRDTLLNKTDKYIVADYPHATSEIKQAWLDYRQALRDLPANTTDPENPVWPEAPK